MKDFTKWDWETIKLAVHDYEEKHYNGEDDIWQNKMNDLIDKIWEKNK